MKREIFVTEASRESIERGKNHAYKPSKKRGCFVTEASRESVKRGKAHAYKPSNK